MYQPVPILLYHSISDVASPQYRACTVTPEAFAAQMAYLHEQGFTPLTVTQFVRARKIPGQLPTRPVVITFDDGLEDFYTGALPVLQRHNFSATLYVVTKYVGSTSRWLEREGEGERPMLTWGQLAAIDAAGIECGAHSHTHPQLDLLPRPMMREEVTKSKVILEQHLGRPITTFAYPYGYFGIAVRRIVQEAGFFSACAVRNVLSSTADNPLSLGRIEVTPDITLQDFGALLAGHNLYTISSARERPRSVVRRVQLRFVRRLQDRRRTPDYT